MQHLSFREELHAIEAVIAGQGVGIFSDALVAHEFDAGTLVTTARHVSPSSAGWRRSGSRRTSRCGTRAGAMTARSHFTFDKVRDVYTCPAGKMLTTTSSISTDHTIRYNASLGDCRTCALKAKCCPNVPARRIVREIHEDARDIARRKMTTKAFARYRDV